MLKTYYVPISFILFISVLSSTFHASSPPTTPNEYIEPWRLEIYSSEQRQDYEQKSSVVKSETDTRTYEEEYKLGLRLYKEEYDLDSQLYEEERELDTRMYKEGYEADKWIRFYNAEQDASTVRGDMSPSPILLGKFYLYLCLCSSRFQTRALRRSQPFSCHVLVSFFNICKS